MKRRILASLVSLALVVTLVASVFAAAVPEKVGVVKDDKYTPEEAALIEKAMKAEYEAQLNAGFNPGKNDGYAHWWDGPCSQNFKEGDSTATEWGIPNLCIIFVNKPGDPAYTVKNDMIVAFAQGGATSALGGPTSNEFVKDGKVCQNFEKGAFVDYEWQAGLVVEVPADKPASKVPEKVGVVRDDKYTAEEGALIEKAMKAEYEAQLAAGYNPGQNEGYAHWWDGPCTQNFKNGDSTANLWGMNNVTVFFVNKPGDPAYIIKNDMAVAFEQSGATNALGGPTSNEFIKDGKVCQNFEKGAFVDYEWYAGLVVEAPAVAETPVANEEPVKEEPAKEEPAKQEPVKAEEPAKTTEAPAKEEPANNPKTSDVSSIIFIAAAGVSGLALFTRKRK